MTHYVIIGHEGFIGRYVTRLIENQSDNDVLSLIGREGVLTVTKQGRECCNLGQWLKASHKTIDYLLYLAWDSTPYSSMKSASSGTNLAVCEHYFNQLSDHHLKTVIFLSSAGAIYRTPEALVLDEHSSPLLQSPYAEEKLKTEQFLLDKFATSTDTGVIILRPSNVYGPAQKLKRGMGIIPMLFSASQGQHNISLYEPLHSARDYLYIDDFLAALKLCIDGDIPSGIYNLSSGALISLQELIETIVEITGEDIQYSLDIKLDANLSGISSTKFRATSGWVSHVALKNGLAEIWSRIHE